MQLDDVIKIAKKEGFETAEKVGRLDEWDIYDPIYSTSKTAFIGQPSFIGVSGDKVKWFIGAEAFDVIDRLGLDQEDEDL